MNERVRSELRRRDFVHAGLAAAAGIVWGATARSGAADELTYPAKSVGEAFELAGYDPTAPGNATFVVAADCHYGLHTGDGVAPIVQEINAMRPLPAFLVVNGDLALTVSRRAGRIPDSRERETGRAELLAFRRHVERLKVPLKMTLGNHDTHPGELDPEIFWSVFPDAPPYYVDTLAGVDLFFLNGHCDGNLDAPQRRWFSTQVREMGRKGEAIVFVHQPSLGYVAAERGIAIAMHEAFREVEKPLWLIGGHRHTNAEKLFRLPRTTIVQHTIVCSAEGIWGGPEKPGYWIYCLSGGKVQARIFRRMQHGFRVQGAVTRAGGGPLPLPYAEAEGLLWKIFVGEGDREYRVQVDAGDVGTWFAYVKEITYRMPLRGHGERPGRVGVLGTVNGGPITDANCEVFLSATNGSVWEPVRMVKTSNSVTLYDIPAALQHQPELLVKCVSKKGPWIAGFSLWS